MLIAYRWCPRAKGNAETLHKCDLRVHSAFQGKLKDKLVYIGPDMFQIILGKRGVGQSDTRSPLQEREFIWLLCMCLKCPTAECRTVTRRWKRQTEPLCVTQARPQERRTSWVLGGRSCHHLVEFSPSSLPQMRKQAGHMQDGKS